MKHSIIYTIHDTKAELYHPPRIARTKADAIRSFTMGANDKDTQLGHHPEDFVLYQIGTYDDLTGQITPTPHLSLGKAIEYVTKGDKQ